MKKIVIKKRATDWRASFDADPGKWDRGRTPEEALGALISAYGAELGLMIEINDAIFPQWGK